MNTTLWRLGAKLLIVLMLIIIGVHIFNMLSKVTNKYYQNQDRATPGLGWENK